MKTEIKHIVTTDHNLDAPVLEIDSLELFRTNFPLTSVMVYDEEMVYRMKMERDANYWKIRAEEIISRLHLPLAAKVQKLVISYTLIIEKL